LAIRVASKGVGALDVGVPVERIGVLPVGLAVERVGVLDVGLAIEGVVRQGGGAEQQSSETEGKARGTSRVGSRGGAWAARRGHPICEAPGSPGEFARRQPQTSRFQLEADFCHGE